MPMLGSSRFGGRHSGIIVSISMRDGEWKDGLSRDLVPQRPIRFMASRISRERSTDVWVLAFVGDQDFPTPKVTGPLPAFLSTSLLSDGRLLFRTASAGDSRLQDSVGVLVYDPEGATRYPKRDTLTPSATTLMHIPIVTIHITSPILVTDSVEKMSSETFGAHLQATGSSS